MIILNRLHFFILKQSKSTILMYLKKIIDKYADINVYDIVYTWIRGI
jgi:hypothetical protein